MRGMEITSARESRLTYGACIVFLTKCDKVGCVLLPMPLPNVLSGQWKCYVCHTMLLALSLQRIINRFIDGMGATRIKPRVGHLRWSRTLVWNSWAAVSSLCTKLDAGRSRQARALA